MSHKKMAEEETEIIVEEETENSVNSNKSKELNMHNYANENYNQHGEYDPNFNAGLSSYKPPHKHEEEDIKYTEDSNETVKNNLLESQVEVELKKRRKKLIKFIGLGIFILLVLIIVVFILKTIFKKDKILFEDLTQTDSFFIANDTGYYALFNEDGEQLSDFEFVSGGTFYGGVTRVEHKNGTSGIIKEDGEYLVPLNDGTVSGNYSLFLIREKGETKTKIKNFRGDVVSKGESLVLNSYAYGALYSIVEGNSKDAKILNYNGSSMGELENIDDYKYFSYDGSYATLMSETTTVLYNVDEAKKLTTIDGEFCIYDTAEKTVILHSCTKWESTDGSNIYKVVKNGEVLYTLDSKDITLSLTKDGYVLSRKIKEDYYNLLDDKGNVKQQYIIGYQDGKNYVVEIDDRLMFYKNNERKNILDCATYYRVASDELYVVRVDRYADGCKEDIDNQYSYYDLAGNKKAKDFYAAGVFNKEGRAIVSTDNLENYIIDSNFKILSGEHYSLKAVGSLYIVWDEKHNQALLDKNGIIIEDEIKSYTSYGTVEEEESYVAVEIKENTYTVYDTQTGNKLITVQGDSISLFKQYFVVDNSYYSYKTGKKFYSEN